MTEFEEKEIRAHAETQLRLAKVARLKNWRAVPIDKTVCMYPDNDTGGPAWSKSWVGRAIRFCYFTNSDDPQAVAKCGIWQVQDSVMFATLRGMIRHYDTPLPLCAHCCEALNK